MQRGYSRDHRPDCEPMVIALIVNREGFPLSYETFDGSGRMYRPWKTILRPVASERPGVADLGDGRIASEENLATIRKRGGQSLAGTPRTR